MEKKYQNNPNYILREIENECVLVPVDESCIVTNGIISLNDTSAFLWKCFQTPTISRTNSPRGLLPYSFS